MSKWMNKGARMCGPMTEARDPDDAGFSIIEALVALAVFALAGVGLVQLQTHSLTTLTRVETHALAMMVAQNRLVDAIASLEAPALGVSSGETEIGGRAWRWRMTVEVTDDVSIRRVTVTASDVRPGGVPVALHAFRASGTN